MHHVSASPPFHPGQSVFPSPVGDPGISLLDLPMNYRSLNAGSYTPLEVPVYPIARHITEVTSFTRPGVLGCSALVPAKAESLFACSKVLPACSVISRITSEGITPPSSLILAHAPNQIPPSDFVLLFQRVLAGCRQSLLGDGPSRRYLRNPYIGAWTPNVVDLRGGPGIPPLFSCQKERNVLRWIPPSSRRSDNFS